MLNENGLDNLQAIFLLINNLNCYFINLATPRFVFDNFVYLKLFKSVGAYKDAFSMFADKAYVSLLLTISP